MLQELLSDLLADGHYVPEASYASSHQPGADYVCVLRSAKLTVKLYRFDPARYVPVGDAWGRPIAVNPHNHRYPFQTLVLTGGLTNVKYDFNEIMFATPVDRRYVMYEFETALGRTGPPTVKLKAACRLWCVSEYTMGPGQSYNCRPDEVHSVIPHSWRETIVCLFQHDDDANSTALLFARADSPPSFEGLYQPLPRAAAMDIIGKAQRAARAVLPDCFGRKEPRPVGRDLP